MVEQVEQLLVLSVEGFDMPHGAAAIFGDTEIRCMSEGVVEIVGLSDLEAVGIGNGIGSSAEAVEAWETIDSLLEGKDASAWPGRLVECVDMEQVAVQIMMHLGASEEDARCRAAVMAESERFDEAMAEAITRSDTDGADGFSSDSVFLQLGLRAVSEWTTPEGITEGGSEG